MTVLRKSRFKEERILPPEDRKYIDIYLDRSVPEKHKIATQRSLLGQAPRSLAIRVKCLQCTNYDREEVIHCRVLSCALHTVRPYQDKNTLEETEGGEADE